MSDSLPTPPTVPPSPQKPKFKKNKEVTSSFWENAECKRRNGRISASGKENTEGDKEKITTIVSSQNYTVGLSDVFPSFAGVATRKEYCKAFLYDLLFQILIGITLIVICQFSNDVLVDVSTVLLMVFYIMFNLDNIRVYAKRFHAFGWSYTHCWVIPMIILSFLSFVFIASFCFKGFIIMIALGGIYGITMFLICSLCNASIDKSLDAKKIEKDNKLDNKLDENYDASLHQAAYKGQIEVVKQLIDAGANVNKIDTRGRTPLDYAVSMRRSEVVKLLVKAGAKK